uniref:Uncharacterized protein n=1 Tax=viral metagenome TaxID=1070528 RepID=A0A6C0JGG2_9ZZZZ
MTVYISTENQNTLWNVIQKNPDVTEFFAKNRSQLTKEMWFKSILRIFYNENQYRKFTKPELFEINKQTITYMVNDIRRKNVDMDETQKQINTNSLPSNVNIANDNNQFLKSYSVIENKVDKIGNKYAEKESEYNALFDKKVPEEINFSEKQDTPLPNMEDLIKQHLREREEEVIKYAPLPLAIPTISANTQPNVPNPITNKLKIENSSESVNIQVEEIDEVQESKDKKSVKWSDDSYKELIEKQQNEIDSLKTYIETLTEKIKNLEGNSQL